MTDEEEAKRTAVASVFEHWLIRRTCRRDVARCGRIADTVWGCCSEVHGRDMQELGTACRTRLQSRADYRDTVSFIPTWLLAVLLKLIIGILIDAWLSNEKGK